MKSNNMALMICKECGRTISDKATACPHCGSPVSQVRLCEECGESLPEYATVCPNCGCPASNEIMQLQPHVAEGDTPIYIKEKSFSNKQICILASVVGAILLFILALQSGIFHKRELFEKTDYFVESLSTTVQSYGLLGGTEYTEYAEDYEYRIMPMGRLINVRIEREASSSEYEKLRKSLERHYSDDSRVNQVYICEGGTVMIDCRN